MTLEAKKRVLAGTLLLFLLWPLVHRWLVARYEVSPWKLFGWAMYCEPQLPVSMRLLAVRQGEEAPIDPARLDAAGRERLRDFQENRPFLGQLAPPDDLGAALLDAVPDADSVSIVVTRLRLSPETARVGVAMRRYSFER